MLSWYRDGKLISKNYDTIESMKTTESVYRIGKVTPGDNKALFQCDSINQAMDNPYSSSIKLNVLYGPTKLTMTGVFEVEAGKEISAKCFSDAANPSPKLRFSFNGHDYEPNSFSSKPTDAKVAIGAYTVNGTFVKTVTQSDNNKELKCYAENKLANVQQIVTQMIKVLYPPDSLEIIYPHENKTMNEGTKVYVTCVSRGGNPLPKIKWTLSDGSELAAAKTQSIIYTHESILELVLDRKHHNQVVTCEADNAVGSLSQSTKLRVSCKFFFK